MTNLDDYTNAFKNLFQGRQNCFALQLEDGTYRPYEFGFRQQDIESHLFFKTDTYALYLNRLDNTVMVACIDIDVDKKPLLKAIEEEGEQGLHRLLGIVKEEMKRQSQFLKSIGIPHAIEFSGRRGYHIWFFFDRPIPAYYIVKLGEKVVLKRNKVITAPEHYDDQYEYVPKHAYVSLDDKGSQIKMPLGLHRVTKGYCYFIDNDTFEQVDKQFEYLVWLDKFGRVKSENLEKVINEKIDYDLNNKDQELLIQTNQTFKKHSHSKSAYAITIPDEQMFKNKLHEMINLIEPYNPYVKKYGDKLIPSQDPIKEHITKCPPCIYEVYKRSLFDHKEYEARTVLVRFFASKGYTPEDIAGFFYYHVNDADDNKHEDVLKYQVAYYYGDRSDPARLDSCKKLQEKGYCINFGFKKAAQTQLLTNLIKIKQTIKDQQKIMKANKKDIVFFRNDIIQNPKAYEGIDLDQQIREIEKNTKNLEQLRNEEIERIKKSFTVICQRVWNPNSRHDELDQLKKDEIEFEDRLEYKSKTVYIKDLSEDMNKPDDHIVNVEIGIESIPECIINGNESDLLQEPSIDSEPKDLTDKSIELVNPNEETSKTPSQCWSQETFEEINRKSTETIDSATKTKEKMIHIIHKTTRAGVTTSLILNSFKLHQKVVLVAPTNNIGRDTFGHVIKISEEMCQCGELERVIYGANFASNDKMCLTLYKKIYSDLPEEKNMLSKDLTVLNDLPFLFKTSCVQKVKGKEIYCPYYSCVHIGYPKDAEGNVTPLVMSNVPKCVKKPFCTQFHHAVQPDDTCFHKERLDFEVKCGDCRNQTCKKDKPLDADCSDPKLFENTKCKECRYFKDKFEYYEPNSRPICAYATIFRHLIEDWVNIQIMNTNVITMDQLQQDHSGRIVYMSREEVKQQIDDGFIPVSNEYCDDHWMLRDDITMLHRIHLKKFDALTLTYTKIRALYQSVENIKILGRDDIVSFSEEIINAIRNGYNGIVCDEVSHLVAQASLQFGIFSISRNINDDKDSEKDSEHQTNFFDDINREIDDINKSIGTARELENLDYFRILRDYFVWFFKEAKHWIFSPYRIVELYDFNNAELKRLISEMNKLINEMENVRESNPLLFNIIAKDVDDINCKIDDIKEKLKNEPEQSKFIKYGDIVKRIYRNDIPEEIKTEIRSLQKNDILDGIEVIIDEGSGRKERITKRKDIRFINSFEIRIKMRKIRKSIRKYNGDPDDDISDGVFNMDTSDPNFYKKEIEANLKINGDSDYERLINEYKQLMSDLTIQPNEIGVVNEIVMKFDDEITDHNSINDIGKFDGYLPKTYVVVGWCRVNSRLLCDCFEREGHKSRLEFDEIFFNMYSYLTNIAMKYNIKVYYLALMLLLANSDSFFINSSSTTEFKTKILLQAMPSFSKIVDLVRSIVYGKNTIDGLNNYAIATDATMPLIDMTTVFGLPTKIWKFGDPKHTCDKQIIITDTHNYTVMELYGKIPPMKNLEKLTPDALKRYMNPNVYHIIEEKNGKPTKVVDISKYIVRFRLLLFINSVCEEYGTKNVFIISPNKSFDDLLSKGITSGIPLESRFVDWIRVNFPKEFDIYCQKDWIKKDKTATDDKPTYSFFIVKIGDASNGDKQYYRGNRTIGTSSNCRVMIAITSPSSPINSCDWLSHFYYEKNYLSDKNTVIGSLTTSELSKALRKVELQGSMFQTISRVKDPQGIEPSVVFMYGVSNGEYKWIKCSLCERDELQIYNWNTESFYDSTLGINSDDIYLAEHLYHGEVVRHDLCYDCIKKYNAKVIGISEKRKENIISDPEVMEDYLAFRIPTPKIIPSTTVYGNRGKSIFDSENRMLDSARLFLNGKKILPSNIVRFKEQLVNRTVDVIKQYKIDITSIRPEAIDEFLTFSVKDLTFRVGKSNRIYWKQLEDELNTYGQENLQTINIKTIKKGKHIKGIQLISLKEIETKI